MRRPNTFKILNALLAVSFWLAQATWGQNVSTPATGNQQNNLPPAGTQTAPANSQTTTLPAQSPSPTTPQTSGATVNPSAAPLQPVTTYPNAADAPTAQDAQPNNQSQTNTAPPNAPEPKTQPAEPQGAATAEKVPTAGGAAAKPAGMAIAPAKQHRTRSLLIKIGAMAAAGAAAGTVYALSRGTSSTPPGASGPGAVPK